MTCALVYTLSNMTYTPAKLPLYSRRVNESSSPTNIAEHVYSTLHYRGCLQIKYAQ